MPVGDLRLTFSWDEITRILTLAKSENPRNYALISTLALSGRRLGELIGRPAMQGRRGIVPEVPGVYVRDINFNGQQIRWTIEKKFEDKAHTKRVVRIKDAQPELLEILGAWIKHNNLGPDDKLFLISERRVHQVMERYCGLAGITDKARLCHALRHGFGLQFAKNMEKPTDMMILQDIMDHVKGDQTMAYINLASEDRKKALAKVSLSQG